MIQFLGRVIYFAAFLKAALYYTHITTKDHIIRKISRMCWTQTYRIRILSVIALGIPFIALNLSVPISYFLINGHLDSKCIKYPSLMTTILFYTMFAFLVVFMISMYLHGKDYSLMRIEFTLFVATSILTSVVYLILKPFFNLKEYQNMAAQFMIFTFYATYFPLLLVLFQRKPTEPKKLIILNESYNVGLLYSVGQEHYCEENVIFLEAYNSYTIDKSDILLTEILLLFIEKRSKYQLNINEDIREIVLREPRQIELVYDQVIELVRCNIIPFIPQKE